MIKVYNKALQISLIENHIVLFTLHDKRFTLYDKSLTTSCTRNENTVNTESFKYGIWT